MEKNNINNIIMSDVIIVKIKDGSFNHEPSIIRDTKNINFIRNLNKNSNGDLLINNNDIVIYTDLFLHLFTFQTPIFI
jgi:hypothetical protein